MQCMSPTDLLILTTAYISPTNLEQETNRVPTFSNPVYENKVKLHRSFPGTSLFLDISFLHYIMQARKDIYIYIYIYDIFQGEILPYNLRRGEYYVSRRCSKSSFTVASFFFFFFSFFFFFFFLG
jgi:hypothetical protein